MSGTNTDLLAYSPPPPVDKHGQLGIWDALAPPEEVEVSPLSLSGIHGLIFSTG